MIHYFNPGHETAVLNASKHYYPPRQVVKMQTDLAFLPAWYASEGDFVFMETSLPDDFNLSLQPFNFRIKPVTPADLAGSRELFEHSAVDLWGISPQSVHLFDQINKERSLSLALPQWKEEFRLLGSRFASQEILAELITRFHEIDRDILPCFVSDIETIEQAIAQSREPLLVKSPYSSSGRGLLRLSPGKLAQSERQILTGMLKKQSRVSIEKLLDKRLDFSMHFEITLERKTQFLGYSIFQTNAKGAYEKSRLAGQECLEKQIIRQIDADTICRIRAALTEKIQEIYSPYYTGVLGVDMLVYQSNDSLRLHPCVEINMRKSMGYLAIRLAEKYLPPDSQGELVIDYNPDPQIIGKKYKQMLMHYPPIIEDGRIRSGCLSLCPITDATNYYAYILIYSEQANRNPR